MAITVCLDCCKVHLSIAAWALVHARPSDNRVRQHPPTNKTSKFLSRLTQGIGVFCTTCFVSSLNFLQKSIILIPRGPSACPIAGPGFAVPAGTRIRTVRTNDIFCGLYAAATELLLQSQRVAQLGPLSSSNKFSPPLFLSLLSAAEILAQETGGEI